MKVLERKRLHGRSASTFDREDDSYVCPDGKRLRSRNRNFAVLRFKPSIRARPSSTSSTELGNWRPFPVMGSRPSFHDDVPVTAPTRPDIDALPMRFALSVRPTCQMQMLARQGPDLTGQ